MATDMKFSDDDLYTNPTPRLPIALVLDVSPSMSGKEEYGADPSIDGVPIDLLNEGIKSFHTAIINNETARYSAEIAILSFSSIIVREREFKLLEENDIPQVELEMNVGGTSLGKAVNEALDMLEERKREYKKAGTDYYQPWLVVMTDGKPTDLEHHKLKETISTMVSNRKLVVFAIGIGDGADLTELEYISGTRKPQKLKELKIEEFFQWLSSSVSRVSASTIGDKVQLDPIDNWADI